MSNGKPRTPRTYRGNPSSSTHARPKTLSNPQPMHKSKSSMELWHQPPPNEHSKLAGQILALCDLTNICERDLEEIFKMDATSRKNRTILKILQQLVDCTNDVRRENSLLRKENEALKKFVVNYIHDNSLMAAQEVEEGAQIPINNAPYIVSSHSPIDSANTCTIEDEELPENGKSRMIVMEKPDSAQPSLVFQSVHSALDPLDSYDYISDSFEEANIEEQIRQSNQRREEIMRQWLEQDPNNSTPNVT
jgi:hypothetical protein